MSLKYLTLEVTTTSNLLLGMCDFQEIMLGTIKLDSTEIELKSIDDQRRRRHRQPHQHHHHQHQHHRLHPLHRLHRLHQDHQHRKNNKEFKSMTNSLMSLEM